MAAVQKEMQTKESSTKGFFEDLTQITQSIIAQAHKVAEQLIMSIEETAHKALANLQKDKPAATAQNTTPTPKPVDDDMSAAPTPAAAGLPPMVAADYPATDAKATVEPATEAAAKDDVKVAPAPKAATAPSS